MGLGRRLLTYASAVPVQLTVILDGIEDAITSPAVQKAAAEAMEDTMRSGTARFIGADMRLSGFRGDPIVFEARYTGGSGEVVLPLKGGTYGLADKGRQRIKRRKLRPKARKRKGQRRPTLRTPYGPRVSVRGSRAKGFRITETVGPKAIGKAVEAAVAEALDRFAAAV